jgi:hypothetical protein
MDTACASALAATHGGATAVRGAGFAEMVALAVSLKLVPHGALGGSRSTLCNAATTAALTTALPTVTNTSATIITNLATATLRSPPTRYALMTSDGL